MKSFLRREDVTSYGEGSFFRNSGFITFVLLDAQNVDGDRSLSLMPLQ